MIVDARHRARAARSRSSSSSCSCAAMRLDAEALDVVDGGGQPDRAGDVRRAGLELVRQLVVGGLLEGHREDHVAAALPRRHRLEQRLAPVEHADAGRAVHLVAGEGVEVAAERAHVDRASAAPPARRRRAPPRRARARPRRCVCDRQHRAERVRDVRHARPGACAATAAARTSSSIELAAAVDRAPP